MAWPEDRPDTYDPNDWWSISANDWVDGDSPSLTLSGLAVGAGYQNHRIVVGADTTTGVPVIYFGTS